MKVADRRKCSRGGIDGESVLDARQQESASSAAATLPMIRQGTNTPDWLRVWGTAWPFAAVKVSQFAPASLRVPHLRRRGWREMRPRLRFASLRRSPKNLPQNLVRQSSQMMHNDCSRHVERAF